MEVFEIIIALLLAGAVLTSISKRIGAPYPALVALAGAGLALVPGTPTLGLDPELALTLFVAPVLLDAAFDSSLRDLRANWRSVAGLAIGAVVFTVAVVALVVRWLVPAMPWSVAIAVGAIVAPPDAAAATAVLKQLRPPHRLLVILEGESLFNDASSLLIFRVALGVAVASATAPVHATTVIPMMAVSMVGSVLLGLALSRVIIFLTARIEDVAIAVVVQFCGTFAVWLLAERLHLSGILTVVIFAMATARRASELIPARVRIPSFAIWEFAVFVLNVLAFILVGFQLKGILERIDSRTLVEYTGIGGAVCVAAIGARIGWVSTSAAVNRWRCNSLAISGRYAAVVGWCGMRGIVTLAAALALPRENFPYRDLILFISFAVVLGTLVVQGLTLRPLMNLLRIRDDGEVDREVREGRIEVLRAALAATDEIADQDLGGVLRRRYDLMLRRAEGAKDAEAAAPMSEGDTAILRRALSAERQRLLALRSTGTIGDAAFQRLEQGLDFEELHLEQLASGNLS